MAHTPGPWIYRFYANGPLQSWDIEATDYTVIARIAVGPMFEDTPDPRDEANARIIAAAPNLLAACEAALDAIHNAGQDEDAWSDATSMLHTAIALARKKEHE